MSLSYIEWTDWVWNLVRGCFKVSPGCKFCYAERFAERFRGVPGHPYEQGFDLRLVPAKLADPLRRTTPSKIFANSMSDLFAEGVPDDYIAATAEVMGAANWHTFQLLTKRAERLAKLSQRVDLEHEHLWVGVSVEDRKFGKPRIEELRRAKVARRFLSIEPLLEDLGELDLRGIDWVIVGGESGGLSTRAMDPAWARSIRDQCERDDVPFFFKQWGSWMPVELEGGEVEMRHVAKKADAGRILDGRTHDAMPTLPPVDLPGWAKRRELVRAAERRAEELTLQLRGQGLLFGEPVQLGRGVA